MLHAKHQTAVKQTSTATCTSGLKFNTEARHGTAKPHANLQIENSRGPLVTGAMLLRGNLSGVSGSRPGLGTHLKR